MLPATDPRDATLATFGHTLGHACAACAGIRHLGPEGFKNPLARLAEREHFVTEATPIEAKARRYEMRQARDRARYRRSLRIQSAA